VNVNLQQVVAIVLTPVDEVAQVVQELTVVLEEEVIPAETAVL